MKALIFCAGLGTRFVPWTLEHPKALAPINGKPLLQRNVEYLVEHGVKNIVVNVHHFADQIEDAIQTSGGWGASIVVSDERAAVLETGGGLLHARLLLEDSTTFLTINADVLTDLDLEAFFAAHQKSGALITLAVTKRETSRKLLFDASGRLCGWRNKQTGAEKIAIHNRELFEFGFSGLALYNSRVLGLIKQTGKFSVIDAFLDLAADHNIGSFDHTGSRWIDVGKPEAVEKAEKMFG